MILYIASHGLSAGRRSAILFEDFHLDPFNKTAGMTETGQLATALSQVDVAGKLLIFDCCRNAGDAPLDPFQTLGLPLIGDMDNAQLPPRMPQILHSTVLGEQAFGAKDGPTLFAQSLLDALSGLAAEPNDDWRVNSTRLGYVTEQLLGLRRRAGQRIQEPQLELTAAFAITQAAETEEVELCVSVAPDFSAAPWQIEVAPLAGLLQVVGPTDDSPDFARLRIAAGQKGEIRLKDAGGQVLGLTSMRLQPPVAFKTLPDDDAIAALRNKSLAPSAGAAPDVAEVSLSGGGSGVAHVTDAAGKVRRLALGGGGPRLQLAPGPHSVVLSRPDGTVSQTDFVARAGEGVELHIPERGSPHEWLQDAVAAGVVPSATHANSPRGWPDEGWPEDLGAAASGPAPPPPGTTRAPAPRPQPLLTLLSAAQVTARLDPAAPAGPGMQAELEGQTDPGVLADPLLTLQPGPQDGRYLLVALRDDAFDRYKLWLPAGPQQSPPWALVEVGTRTEMAFVPTPGLSNAADPGPDGLPEPWGATLLIDAAAPEGTATTAFLQSPHWRTLMGFLGRRDFPASAEALEDILAAGMIRLTVLRKSDNALAALAAGLVAVATAPVHAFEIADDWLANLSIWFSGLPDGACIHGRHLLAQKQTGAARQQFEIAAGRGVPVYALALDWLAEGLATTGSPMATKVRQWSWRSDPHRAFTVLKLKG
jgi:hypothetical protein